MIKEPSRFRPTATVHHMEQVGLDAVPLVALLCYLVGAVVAFLGSNILRDFGATIYVVELVSISFLREFGVLLTAIILAGRTASAFTAQIGAMVSREEVDAIRTLGMDPIDLLVIPRVLALLVMLPLLTFVAMVFGLLGGLTVGAYGLDIPPQQYLARMHETMELRHFVVGLVEGAVLRADHQPDRLPGRPAGGGHRAVGRRTHDLERGAGDLAGDHPRCVLRDLVHGDGLLTRALRSPVRERSPPSRSSACVAWSTASASRSCTTASTSTCCRGEIIGVVGGSGTGKSVLMRSILGLRTPDAGEIEVLGIDARSEDADAAPP